MRTATVVVAGAVALLLGGSASASTYAPSLVVSSTTSAYSGSGSTTFVVSEPEGDDPMAKIDVRAPVGYAVDLTQPFGSTIGVVDVRGKTEPGGADMHLAGGIRTVDPAAYAGAAAACTGQSVNDAVWLLVPGGGIAPIPTFVDRSPARVQFCLPSPGSPGFAVRLFRISLTVTGVFRNPVAGGVYRWSGLLDPYATAPGTGQVESQTVVRLPPQLTLAEKLIVARHRSFVRLTGRLAEKGQGVPGSRIEILAGPTAGTLERLVFTTSFGKGTFEVVVPIFQGTVFKAVVTVGPRAAPVSTCVPISGSAAPCTSVNLAPFSARSKIVRARPR